MHVRKVAVQVSANTAVWKATMVRSTHVQRRAACAVAAMNGAATLRAARVTAARGCDKK
jgi:hypothetical protein